MRNRNTLLLVVGATLFFSGCFEPPVLPNEPRIGFRSLRYIEYTAPTEQDSMLLKFDFEDGDGNIGLNDDYSRYPFHPFNIVVDSRDSVVTISDTSVTPPFYIKNPVNDTAFFSSTDNRPEYNECDYYFGDQYIDLLGDTIYIQDNEYNNNFHIDFLKKRNGQYEVINFSEEFGGTQCNLVNFNGRIPVFDPENNGKTLTGTITYSLFSRGFQIVLAADTFKVRFYIYDRVLNKSNVAESPDLTLQGITVTRN